MVGDKLKNSRKEDPLITVITPNYNYANYIGETINSILNQSYKNWEHVIVDDGSTDNSIEIIEKYLIENSNKIKLICQSNKGQSSALNLAMKHSKGDIFCWINSDDTFKQNTFYKIVEIFKKTRYDIIFGDVDIMDKNSLFMYKKSHLKFNYLSSIFNGFGNTLTSNSIFWKRECSHNFLKFDENYKSNMDGDFFSRLTKGKKVFHINDSLANFRKQEISIAGYKDQNWQERVFNEQLKVTINSYNRLKISKLIPYNYTFILKWYYKVIRILKRMFRFHFIIKKVQYYKYIKNRK